MVPEPAGCRRGDATRGAVADASTSAEMRKSLLPRPGREIVLELRGFLPHALEALAADADELRLEQEAGHGIGREHALGIAEQFRAIGLARRRHDLLVEIVEGLRVVAEIVVGLGQLAEI